MNSWHMVAASLPLVDWLQRTCMAEQTQSKSFVCFFGGAHIFDYYFYVRKPKRDTGWTLLSQNNTLLFMFSVRALHFQESHSPLGW